MTTLVKKIHRSVSGSLTHDRKLAAGAAFQRRAGAQRVDAHARTARGDAASHSAERLKIFLMAGPKGALFNLKKNPARAGRDTALATPSRAPAGSHRCIHARAAAMGRSRRGKATRGTPFANLLITRGFGAVSPSNQYKKSARGRGGLRPSAGPGRGGVLSLRTDDIPQPESGRRLLVGGGARAGFSCLRRNVFPLVVVGTNTRASLRFPPNLNVAAFSASAVSQF